MLTNWSNAQDFVDEKEQDAEKIKDYFVQLGLKVNPDFSPYYAYDWHQIGIENYIDEQLGKAD